MDDKDLKALKDIEVPDPSDDARTAAMHSAMHAFEEAGKKSRNPTQGLSDSTRPMATFIQTFWEWTMEKRMLMGTVAATLLAVPVAAHLIWNNNSGKLAPVTTSEVQEKAAPEKTPGEGRTDTTVGGKNKTDNKQVAVLPPAKVEEHRDVAADEPAPLAENEADDRKPSSQMFDMVERFAKDSEPTVTSPASPSPRAKRAPAPSAQLQLNAPGAHKYQGVGVLRNLRTDEDSPAYAPSPPAEQNRDQFEAVKDNTVKSVEQEPVSTFSIDVDTASYAFVRRNLENGHLPNRNAVRVEEMINYFSYNYPPAETAEVPFKPSVAIYPTPWNDNTMLMHIGIKGHEVAQDEKPRSNLVFLIDVSGSMQSADKLPLLKSAFRLLVDRLEKEDTVSIVTYAGNAGTVLEPTKVSEKAKIMAALDKLTAGGSTAGEQGIRQAYALAQQEFDKNGINRVILATDGDFNVGISDTEQLKSYIETKRKTGIYLSVLGFGQGNYNDRLMQALAQNGNGNAAYIDSLREAQKVLVEEAGSTLFPIATDVKIQVEFNPALVAEYRLVGYETRALNREDFNNDKVDAGDIGSGHTVTAIYELTPAGAKNKFIDDLRYQKPADTDQKTAPADEQNEFAFLKMRYKLPGETRSKLITVPITRNMAHSSVDDLSDDMRFAASVAAFGQKLRGNSHLTEFSYDEILRIASGARGKDPFGYRSEFLSLVRLAKSLDTDAR